MLWLRRACVTGHYLVCTGAFAAHKGNSWISVNAEAEILASDPTTITVPAHLEGDYKEVP